MLQINIENFALNNKNEIKDETGNLQYWTQPDFSYKQRVHIYNSQNNEIGYVQYKILSIQNGNEVFDKHDNPIDLHEYKQNNKTSDWNYDIEYNGVVIAKIIDGKIDFIDNSNIDSSILFIFSLIQ